MNITSNTPLAFVDVETTGTSARHHRVIEVGIVRVDPREPVREYRTFLDPGEHVPAYIASLTGIHSSMLTDAPLFEDVTREVAELLDGALFVAHNAPFDYAFLSEEFRRLGMAFSHPYLCTAKLSRALYPQERRHSLDSIIERFALEAGSRHRALDDARVLHQFLNASRALLGAPHVDAVMQEMVRVRRLPLHIKETQVSSLPDGPGVYLFYGKGDELLYVGKSRKVRTRVRAHFMVDALPGRGRDMLSEVRRIECRETVGEIGALLLESHLIKSTAPPFNVEGVERHLSAVARESYDAQGYVRISLGFLDTSPRDTADTIVALFKSKVHARVALEHMAKEHGLCLHLLGVEKTVPCSNHQIEVCAGACVGKEKTRHYNRRFREAFESYRLKPWPFSGPIAVEERVGERYELFVLDQWKLLAALTRKEGAWEELVPARFSFQYDVYKIFSRELLRKKSRLLVREITSAEQQWILSDRAMYG